jgi:hypothetical protein
MHPKSSLPAGQVASTDQLLQCSWLLLPTPSGLVFSIEKGDYASVFNGSRRAALVCDSRNPTKDIYAYFRNLFAILFFIWSLLVKCNG